MSKLWMAGAAAFVAFSMGTTPVWAASRTVTVQPGQTMWTIAHANAVSVNGLEAANPSVNPLDLQVNTVLSLPSTVTVKPGDTLWKISLTHATTVAALEAANPGVKPRDLLIGTVLNVPSAANPASPATAKAAPEAASPATANAVSEAAPEAASEAAPKAVAKPTPKSTPKPTPKAAPKAASPTAASSTASQNLYWMEHVIYAEAGGLGLQAQIAVGDAVLHRLQTGQYGSTVKAVVFQVSSGHYQFTSVANGQIYHTPGATSVTAAVDVLNHGTDEVPGALVFYNPAKTPANSWVRKQPVIAQIGPLVFAK